MALKALPRRWLVNKFVHLAVYDRKLAVSGFIGKSAIGKTENAGHSHVNVFLTCSLSLKHVRLETKHNGALEYLTYQHSVRTCRVLNVWRTQ